MAEVQKEDLVMNHLVSLTYRENLTPNLERYVDALIKGHLIGHKCPSCGRVYVPGKGYCPLCVVPTGDVDEIEVADRGIVTGFTIVTPVRYYGQKETEPFVYASVLLDGANSTIGGQDIIGVAHDRDSPGDAGQGRVAARRPSAAPPALPTGAGAGVDGSISAFEATGEPDVSRELYQEHIF